MASDPVVAAREMAHLLRSRPRTTIDPEWFRFGDRTLAPAEVVAILTPHLTKRRVRRIEAVLDQRTYSLTVVVDGMVDSGNVSAVMRTADALGVQTFHAIDTARSYKHSRRTSQGAEKWLDRYVWREPESCIGFLRIAGYQIVVAHTDEEAIDVGAVDWARPTAVVLGNELSGVSRPLLAAADCVTVIPVAGFVQSFNISVAAGIVLHSARAARDSAGGHGDLDDEDRDRLRAVFMMKGVRRHDLVVERALQERGRPIRD